MSNYVLGQYPYSLAHYLNLAESLWGENSKAVAYVKELIHNSPNRRQQIVEDRGIAMYLKLRQIEGEIP